MNTLPLEMVSAIAEKLSLADMFHFLMSCKEHAALLDEQQLWITLCANYGYEIPAESESPKEVFRSSFTMHFDPDRTSSRLTVSSSGRCLSVRESESDSQFKCAVIDRLCSPAGVCRATFRIVQAREDVSGEWCAFGFGGNRYQPDRASAGEGFWDSNQSVGIYGNGNCFSFNRHVSSLPSVEKSPFVSGDIIAVEVDRARGIFRVFRNGDMLIEDRDTRYTATALQPVAMLADHSVVIEALSCEGGVAVPKPRPDSVKHSTVFDSRTRRKAQFRS